MKLNKIVVFIFVQYKMTHLETKMDTENNNKLNTVAQASKQLGIGKGAIYRLVKANRLRAIRLGRKIVIPQIEINTFSTREFEGIA